MAVLTSAIRASGSTSPAPDYTTLSLWEDDIVADLVTAADSYVAECYDDWPSGLDDLLLVASRTTSATYNIRITSPAGQRHDGTIGAGFFLASGSYSQKSIRSNADYTEVDNIEVYVDYGNNGAVHFEGSNCTIRNCIVHRLTVNAYGIYMPGSGEINNNLVFDCTDGISVNYTASTVQNNTIANCTTGILGHASGQNHTIINNAIYGCTDDISINNFATGSGDNATDIAIASSGFPNSDGNIFEITSSDFEDTANDDYHLSSTSDLIGIGTNLYSSFTADIDGDTWPSSGAWDIGADYYVSSGTVHDLTATDIGSSTESDNPVLGQVSNLIVDNAESSSELSSPDLSTSGENNLTADNVESASELSNPVIIQGHGLLANNIESTTEASSPQLNTIHNLFSISIESSSETSLPSLIELIDTNVLTATSTESTSELIVPNIGQSHILTVVSIESLSEVSNPSLSSGLFFEDAAFTWNLGRKELTLINERTYPN